MPTITFNSQIEYQLKKAKRLASQKLDRDFTQEQFLVFLLENYFEMPEVFHDRAQEANPLDS